MKKLSITIIIVFIFVYFIYFYFFRGIFNIKKKITECHGANAGMDFLLQFIFFAFFAFYHIHCSSNIQCNVT